MSGTFGYCDQSQPGRPDAFHALCPVSYVDSIGLTHTCECAGHEGAE